MNISRKIVHVGSIAFGLFIGRAEPAVVSLICLAAFFMNLFILPKLSKGLLEYPKDLVQGYSVGMLMYPFVLFVVSVLFWEQQIIMAVAWGALAFGDASAGLVGGALGKRNPLFWNKEKSWAGLLAFWVFGTLLTFFFLYLLPAPTRLGLPDQTWFCIVLAAVLVAGLLETLPNTLDDNLVITGSAAFVAFLGLNIYNLPPTIFALPPRTGIACLAIGLALGIVFYLKKLNVQGIVAGGVVAFSIFLGSGLGGLCVLFTFLTLGFGASAHKKQKKILLQANYETKRAAANVWANGGMAAIFGILAFVFKEKTAAYTLAMACTLAAAAADTLASELGSIYGTNTIHILKLTNTAPGTDGGISREGTIFAILGAILVGMSYAIFVSQRSDHFFLIAVLGFIGCIVDSILGATLQKDKLLNNHTVNFLMCLIVGIIALFN